MRSLDWPASDEGSDGKLAALERSERSVELGYNALLAAGVTAQIWDEIDVWSERCDNLTKTLP